MKRPVSKEKNSYFRLKRNCFLVKGALRGALYDLATGDVYSIDEQDVPLLKALERYCTIEDAVSLVPGLNLRAARAYLRRLEHLGLGRHRQMRRRFRKVLIRKPPLRPDFLWIELTKGCNLKCLHCSNNSGPDKISTQIMKTEDWLTVLRDARNCGARKVQFYGGEPFLFGDDIFTLIDTAQRLGYTYIEVFTNATLMNFDRIGRLKETGTHIAFSLYGHTAQVHEAVTQTPGSFTRTVENVRKMVQAGIQMRVGVVAMAQNYDHIKSTAHFLRRLGVKKIMYDIVRPGGRGCNPDVLGDKLVRKQHRREPDFKKVSAVTFALRRAWHPCFFSKLFIGADGSVKPCPMAQSWQFGNIRETSFPVLLQTDGLKRAWGLNMNLIDTCRECEYRYACFDCRPKVEGQTGDLNAKPPDCLYDPFTGVWSELADEGGNEMPSVKKVTKRKKKGNYLGQCSPDPCGPNPCKPNPCSPDMQPCAPENAPCSPKPL